MRRALFARQAMSEDTQPDGGLPRSAAEVFEKNTKHRLSAYAGMVRRKNVGSKSD